MNILLTGGGRGLGAALAEALAGPRHRARIVVTGRTRQELDDVVARIRRGGGQAHRLVADVADKEAVYPTAGAAAALVGDLDVVIHNAATLGPRGDGVNPLPLLLDTACEDLARALEVNVLGPFRLTKAVVGSMITRGGGLVVHVSSDAAVEAYPRWGAYGASKAALDHLARTWEAELQGTGVQFLRVDPGEMNTRMHAEAVPDADPASLADPTTVAAAVADLVARHAAARST